MPEFTAINPKRRSRSDSNDSARSDNLINESAHEQPVKKQKKADDSGSESDKENIPRSPRDSVDQVDGIYEPPAIVIDRETDETFSGSRIANETDKKAGQEFLYEPSGSLLRDDSVVPEHLRIKKYDTKPPPTPSRNQIIAAAERLISARKKRVLKPDFSDTDSEHNHNLGPISKKREKESSKHLHNAKPSRTRAFQNLKAVLDNDTSDTGPNKTIVNGRAMITATKVASKMQKLLPSFPLPRDPFPEDFTLTELCAQYPNHLFGDNLHPFLQYDWSATKIAKLLPDQSQVVEKDRVTANAIASRLRKAKVALEKLGRYNSLMAGPKPHAELWNNVSERESLSADIESEEGVDQTEVVEVSDEEGESVNFAEGNQETIALLRQFGSRGEEDEKHITEDSQKIGLGQKK